MRIIYRLLFFLIALLPISVHAESVNAENFYYKTSDNPNVASIVTSPFVFGSNIFIEYRPTTEVNRAATQLRTQLGSNATIIFYHDHTSEGGPISNADVVTGHSAGIIVIARTGSSLGIMVPMGSDPSGNPLAKFYTAKSTLLGL